MSDIDLSVLEALETSLRKNHFELEALAVSISEKDRRIVDENITNLVKPITDLHLLISMAANKQKLKKLSPELINDFEKLAAAAIANSYKIAVESQTVLALFPDDKKSKIEKILKKVEHNLAETLPLVSVAVSKFKQSHPETEQVNAYELLTRIIDTRELLAAINAIDEMVSSFNRIYARLEPGWKKNTGRMKALIDDVRFQKLKASVVNPLSEKATEELNKILEDQIYCLETAFRSKADAFCLGGVVAKKRTEEEYADFLNKNKREHIESRLLANGLAQVYEFCPKKTDAKLAIVVGKIDQVAHYEIPSLAGIRKTYIPKETHRLPPPLPAPASKRPPPIPAEYKKATPPPLPKKR
jgi:hypothetical protein